MGIVFVGNINVYVYVKEIVKDEWVCYYYFMDGVLIGGVGFFFGNEGIYIFGNVVGQVFYFVGFGISGKQFVVGICLIAGMVNFNEVVGDRFNGYQLGDFLVIKQDGFVVNYCCFKIK